MSEEQEVTIETLDSILKDEPESKEQVGKQAAEQANADTKEPENQQSVGDKETETPAVKEEPDAKVPVAALKDERRKRQEAEARHKELEEKLAEIEKQKQNTKQQEQEVNPVDDPEGAHRQLKGIILHERINLSREMMIDAKPDYLDMENVFVDLAKQNPSLVAEMNASPNPAKFAYNKAKEHSEYQDFLKNKDSDEYKEFLEFKKTRESENKAKETPEEKRIKSAVNVPDLVNATSGSLGTKPIKRERLSDILDG